MGISGILEIASYLFNKYAENLQWHEKLSYAWDVYNCLQGLLIFILFVPKSHVYYIRCEKDWGSKRKKRMSSNATTAVHDISRVKYSASNNTLMSKFQVSLSP